MIAGRPIGAVILAAILLSQLHLPALGGEADSTSTQSESESTQHLLATLTDSRLVFTNQLAKTLVVLDAHSHEIVGSVNIGEQTNKIAISPDGRTAYVSARNASKIFVIDVAALSSVGQINVREPSSLVFSSNGAIAYVAGYPHTVSVIDTETGSVIKKLTGIPWPGHMVPVREKGQVLVAYNEGIAVIDEETHKFVNSVKMEHPVHLVVAPGAKVAFASSGDGGKVSIVDLSDYSVTASKTVGRWTRGLAVTPDGSKLYVVDSAGAAFIVLDAKSLQEIGRVQLPNQDVYNVLIPDNSSFAFINSGSPMTGFRGKVIVIDIESLEIATSIPMTDNAVGELVAAPAARP